MYSIITGGMLPQSQRGKRTTATIHIADFYSTFAGLAGLSPEEVQQGATRDASQTMKDQMGGIPAGNASVPPLDSIDQWPLISGATSKAQRTEAYLTENAFMKVPWKII